MINIITCPICKTILKNNNKFLICKNNHSFDIAKQGYVNLLPVQNKKSLNPGDTKEMLQGRRDFLNNGWYKPICDTVIKSINDNLKALKSPIIVDVGCGEGYYTEQLHKNINNSKCIGIDISKDGVKMACNRDKSIDWLVATASHLPLLDNSIDCIITMFALFAENEFLRILKKGGYAIEVTVANEHLIELKRIIYDELFEQHKKPVDLSDDFETVSCKKYSFKIKLENSALKSLLQMTPHFWRIKQEKRRLLEQTQSLECSVAFWLRVVRKR